LAAAATDLVVVGAAATDLVVVGAAATDLVVVWAAAAGRPGWWWCGPTRHSQGGGQPCSFLYHNRNDPSKPPLVLCW